MRVNRHKNHSVHCFHVLTASPNFCIQLRAPGSKQSLTWGASLQRKERRQESNKLPPTPPRQVDGPQENHPPLPIKLLVTTNLPSLLKNKSLPWVFLPKRAFNWQFHDVYIHLHLMDTTHILSIKATLQKYWPHVKRMPSLQLFPKSTTTNATYHEKLAQPEWKTNMQHRQRRTPRNSLQFQKLKDKCSDRCSNKKHFLPDDFLRKGMKNKSITD